MKINYNFMKDASVEIDENGRLSIKDFDGNEIYSKNSDGFECWYEYDKNNNKIHYKDSDGLEWQRLYDSNNNIIRYNYSNGREFWFDSKGNKITEKEYIINVLIKWRNESNESNEKV